DVEVAGPLPEVERLRVEMVRLVPLGRQLERPGGGVEERGPPYLAQPVRIARGGPLGMRAGGIGHPASELGDGSPVGRLRPRAGLPLAVRRLVGEQLADAPQDLGRIVA